MRLNLERAYEVMKNLTIQLWLGCGGLCLREDRIQIYLPLYPSLEWISES
jgi:hypothetical protein